MNSNVAEMLRVGESGLVRNRIEGPVLSTRKSHWAGGSVVAPLALTPRALKLQRLSASPVNDAGLVHGCHVGSWPNGASLHWYATTDGSPANPKVTSPLWPSTGGADR